MSLKILKRENQKNKTYEKIDILRNCQKNIF